MGKKYQNNNYGVRKHPINEKEDIINKKIKECLFVDFVVLKKFRCKCC